jgi:Ca2+-binding EF-hand superfamily protein
MIWGDALVRAFITAIFCAALIGAPARAADTTTLVRDMLAACGNGFAAADANGDGWVTRAEAGISISEGFALLDGNADGKVTQEEFALCRAGSGSVTVTRTATVLRSDDVFFTVDRDSDQNISREEWYGAVEARYLKLAADGQPIAVAVYRKAVADIDASTDTIDKNGDGIVSVDVVSNDALAAFRRNDRNGNDRLSPAEFTAHRTSNTEPTTEQALEQQGASDPLAVRWARLDSDGDGEATFEEYRALGETQFRDAANAAGSDPDVAAPVSAFQGSGG